MMMKTKLCITGILSLSLLTAGCQTVTKSWGGTTTINVEEGKRLVPYTVQWEPRNSNLWYLTEDMPDDYIPKTYEFRESSNLGVAEGTIYIVEHKKGSSKL